MEPVNRIPGVVYTNGTSIPPGLSGYYLGKTASPKPHATARPVDPATPAGSFEGLRVATSGGFLGLTSELTVSKDLAYANAFRGGEPRTGTLPAELGARLVSTAGEFLASNPPAEQVKPHVSDARLSRIELAWGGSTRTFRTDGIDVTPQTRALLDALDAVENLSLAQRG